MNRQIALIAGLALIPAMIGPLPTRAQQLKIALCGGGSASVPLGGNGGPGNGSSPCCAKGCHGGQTRKRLDRTQ